MNKCRKCGNKVLSIEYIPKNMQDVLCENYPHYSKKEHLHKKCQVCGYMWAEKCLDDIDVLTDNIKNDKKLICE